MELGTHWLVQGPNNVGGTATALEFLYEFNRRGLNAYVFDIGDSIFAHRIADLDTSKILVIRPQGPEELASALSALAKEDQQPLMIFDSLHLFREDEVWRIQYNQDNFLGRCQRMFRHPTIVMTERTRMPGNRGRWKNLLTLEYGEGWTVGPQEKVGHTVTVRGPLGSIRGYVDYNAGRFSKRYFEAAELVRQGKSPSTVFEFQGKEVKGMRNFVLETDPIAEQ